MSKRIAVVLLILGFSSNLFAATINIIKKEKVESIKAIRFDLCSNGKMSYSAITSARDSQSGCSEKRYFDRKSNMSNFRNGDLSTVKIGEVEIKSPNEAFADVLYERIMYMTSEQPSFQKKLVGIAVQNEEVGDEGDKSIQAQIFLFEENSPVADPRKFFE